MPATEHAAEHTTTPVAAAGADEKPAATCAAPVAPSGELAPWAEQSPLAAAATAVAVSLAGGAWLLVLFVIPLVSGLIVSLMSGNPEDGYSLTWNWGVYADPTWP